MKVKATKPAKKKNDPFAKAEVNKKKNKLGESVIGTEKEKEKTDVAKEFNKVNNQKEKNLID